MDQATKDTSFQAEQGGIEKSYDDFPYESHPFPQTHPDRLALLGTLFGMTPESPLNCRVLELGCASGGNLIPMALQLPQSSFYGIDLSSAQITEGKELIDQLGLNNIEIEHQDIMEVSQKTLGKFDYIICHGVFSWVPETVQQKILEIAGSCLSENGIAYISYNTYPGWHMRGSIRNMMQYHASNFANMRDKVNQSRALLSFLAESVSTQDNPYGQYLQRELKNLSQVNDSYIAHEHLEGHNTPLYFHSFIESAENHDLQYLGEAEFGSMLASNFQQKVADTLKKVGRNVIQMEQYMDFLRNRMFRSTLLCHKSHKLNRNVNAQRLKELHIASPVRPVEPHLDLSPDNRQNFSMPNKSTIGTSAPITKAALKILGDNWPASIKFTELYDQAASLAGLPETEDRSNLLATDLLTGYTSNAVELHILETDLCMEVSDNPSTSILAREQAKKSLMVTNLRHEISKIDEPTRQLLTLLDGTRDFDDLCGSLIELVERDVLVLRQEGANLKGTDQAKPAVETFVRKTLLNLGRRALLTG